MVRGNARPEGERKQVTAVFIDLVEFSEVASVADPEDLQGWLEDFYQQSRDIVERNGGEVTEYLGDGVIALFGLSKADELAASKAVDAALCSVAEINAGFDGRSSLKLRAGVATGEVAIRTGTQREAWPRVTGMVTTLAQRIQSLAAPGTVMIAQSTRQLLRGKISVTPHPEQKLKGFAESQTLYQAQFVTPQPEFANTGGFVGRTKECATIQAASGPVLVVGEAGIGKSALVSFFARQATDTNVFQADAIHSGSSYQPFKDWIAHQIPQASPGFEDIRSAFPALELQELLSLALIMGIPEGQRLLTELSNFALKGQIESSIWRAICSAQNEGLLIFEDLHWFDVASFGAVQHILQSANVADYRVLLTSRESAKLVQYLNDPEPQRLVLDQLPEDDAFRMLDKLSNGALDTKTRQKLVARAAGVPLFLEQLYKRGAHDTASVPETLMDLLAERIDATAGAKPMLQRASAIGRNFRLDMLEALTPEGEDLRAGLTVGVQTGVLRKRSETEWSFAHALMLQAAYQSLLRKTREALHSQIVEILQTQFPALLAGDPALLADHQSHAQQFIPAIQSYLSASQWALMQGAFSDAEAHARAALALCDKADQESGDVSDLAIACHTALGSILMQVQGFTAEPVRQAFDAVHEIASTQTVPGEASAAALFGSFSYAIIAGEKQKADRFCDLLGEVATSLPKDGAGSEVHLAALATLNCACFYQGDFKNQFEQISKIRDLYRIEDHATMIARYGMDIFAAAQMFEPPARAICGQVDQVEALLAETDAHQAALNIPVMQPYALIWGAVPLFYAGKTQAALERLQKGIDIANEQSAAFWQLTGQTWLHVMNADLCATSQGLEEFGNLVEMQRAIGANVGVPYFAAVYADRLAQGGRINEAYAVSSNAVAEARQSGLHCWYAEILRIHAAISRKAQHIEEADTALTLARDVSDRQGARLWNLRACLDQVEIGDDTEVDLPALLAAFPPNVDLPEIQRAQAYLARS